MIEGDGGVLDNDATMEGDMFHDQGSAVIMRLTRHVEYTPVAIPKSWRKSPVLYNEEGGGPERFKRTEIVPSTSKDRIVCLWGGLVRTLDIPSLEALE